LFQRWIYRVDKNRNEYGDIDEDAAAPQPAQPNTQDKPKTE
jgi:hypothetical protein